MNLGPKDERIPVKRDTLESLLVAIQMGQPHRRRATFEANRLRRLLRDGGE
jgi:hypothetical protein